MTFIEVLKKHFDSEELTKIRELEEQINFLKIRIEHIPDAELDAGFKKLAIQRTLGSSSLRRGDSARWLQVNEFVQHRVDQYLYPTWNDLCEINSLLTSNKSEEVIRTQEIYVGPYAACSVLELADLLNIFKNEILNSHQQLSPLTYASLCQYWLISLHPFNDANGRTSVLLTDWILALNDYLPQSFTNKADCVVMYQPGRPTMITPGRGVIRILKNILNSYLCFKTNNLT